MGCLALKVTAIHSPIKLTILANPNIEFTTTVLNSPISIKVSEFSNPFNVKVKKIGKLNLSCKALNSSIISRCSIICSVDIIPKYITIAENYINLDYLGNPVTINVDSNTNWTVILNAWEDGSSPSVAYEGFKDGTATFSSSINEGIDRETIATFNAGAASAQLGVIQIGMREVFADFNVKEGTFNVLKHGNTKFSKEQ